jgi:hypothetical protein
MKKNFTLCVLLTFVLVSHKANAQFTENFDGGINSLTGNCWLINQVDWTNTTGEVITGTGSLYSNPPVNGSSTRDITSPALNVISTSFTVTFNYKLSSKINGNATRFIEVGLLDASNNFTSLTVISLDKNSPTTVQTYSNTFTVTTGLKKLVIKMGGATGDGNTRIILDNLATSANAQYGPDNRCNSAPVAINDVFNGLMGGQVSGNVLTNDNDPNGETMTPSIVTPSPDGVVVLNPDGSFNFNPDPFFTGTTTSFTYRLNDNGFSPLSSNIATVTINLIAASALPVYLIRFQGNMNKSNKVTLNWTAADNETVDHFEVERSVNGKDFTTAAIVFATEKTGVEDYLYFETINSNDKVMFRLKMFDDGQEINYSRILVFQPKSNNSTQLKVYGNPVNDKLTFSYTSTAAQPADVRVYDMNGRIIMSQKVNSLEGSNMMSLPLSSTFKTGMYVVEVNNGSDRQTAKFVKQ